MNSNDKSLHPDEIYLDANATTPLHPKVIEAITDSLSEYWANPSSGYPLGVKCKQAIERARGQVAEVIGARPDEITFTSCGTESNNLVINSVLTEGRRVHIICTDVEHPSVVNMLKKLQAANKADVSFVNVANKTGRHFVEGFISCLRYDTVLISAMLANNETGIIHPIEELGRAIHTMKIMGTVNDSIKVHTDAAQALGKVKVNVDTLCCDYLTLTGHKFYGPRAGALYTRIDTYVRPLMYGGGQENSLRPGTENTAMIVGLGKAAELVSDNLAEYIETMRTYRDLFIELMTKEFGSDVFHVNNNGLETLPNTCNFCVTISKLRGIEILERCPEINASVGAACHSNVKDSVSSVLIASGIPRSRAMGAIRLSTGRYTTREDIITAASSLIRVIRSSSSTDDDVK